MPRVWPGTSVIFAACVETPKRRSSSREKERPARKRSGDISSEWVVKGRACQRMRPRSMARSSRATSGAGRLAR